MIFNDKFLFIHIPKTGGTSLKASIGENNKVVAGGYFVHPNAMDKHIYLKDVQFDIGNRFVFTIVRNPWAQRVSWYEWWRGSKHIPQTMTFGYFIKHRNKTTISSYLDDRFDKIYRFDKMAEMYTDLSTFFGMELKPKKLAVSLKVDFHYYYTPELYKYVEQEEAALINKFGYTFDDNN